MLPYLPPPKGLRFQVTDGESGVVRCLTFGNDGDVQNTNVNEGSMDGDVAPPWLTFGLLYDLVEEVWFQSPVWKADFMCIDFKPWSSSDPYLRTYMRDLFAKGDTWKPSCLSETGEGVLHVRLRLD